MTCGKRAKSKPFVLICFYVARTFMTRTLQFHWISIWIISGAKLKCKARQRFRFSFRHVFHKLLLKVMCIRCTAWTPLGGERSGRVFEENVCYKYYKMSSSGSRKSFLVQIKFLYDTTHYVSSIFYTYGISWEGKTLKSRTSNVNEPALQASCPLLQYRDSLDSCTL